jgi:hypothetical protein
VKRLNAGDFEDNLVNGPPWNTQIAVRVQSFVPGEDGSADADNNRAFLFQEIGWGRLVRWEDYEDTQRVAGWDTPNETTDQSPLRREV